MRVYATLTSSQLGELIGECYKEIRELEKTMKQITGVMAEKKHEEITVKRKILSDYLLVYIDKGNSTHALAGQLFAEKFKEGNDFFRYVSNITVPVSRL